MDKQRNIDPCFKKVPVPGRKLYEIPDAVVKLLDASKELNEEEFEIFQLEMLKARKHPKEHVVKLKNLLIAEEKRAKPKARQLPETVGSGQPSTVDPRPSSSGFFRSLPAPVTQVPLIVRTDLAAMAEVVTIDTEKIISNTHQMMSGDVSVVDLKGRILYWAFINRKRDEICRLNSSHTGLTMEKIDMGIPLEVMQATIGLVLKGKKVAGFSLTNDFIHLGYGTQSNLPTEMQIIELQRFYVDEDGHAIKLAQLAYHFLGSDPQKGTHSSLRDARITAICYKRMLAFQEAKMTQFKCSNFNKYRREQKSLPKEKQKWEACNCGLTVPKKTFKKKKTTPQLFFSKLDNFNDMDLSDYE